MEAKRAGVGPLLCLLLLAWPLLASAETRADSPHGDLADACSTCHDPEQWLPAQVDPAFEHAYDTPGSRGAHASLDCVDCHPDLAFSATSSDCVDCHLDVHRGELGVQCDRCHGTRSFVDVAEIRRMHRLSRFPLTGAHASTDCQTCHPPLGAGQLQWLGAPADCWSCHQREFEATVDPDHEGEGFREECEFCHGTVSWLGGVIHPRGQREGQ